MTGSSFPPGHQKCDLLWTMGTDLYLDGVVVQRNANAGDYPVYPLFVAAWPTVTPYYPGTHLLGTNVYTGGAASRQVDRQVQPDPISPDPNQPKERTGSGSGSNREKRNGKLGDLLISRVRTADS